MVSRVRKATANGTENMKEAELETEIEEPRITPAYIDRPISREDFDADIGRELARSDARRKIWVQEGGRVPRKTWELLRQRLDEMSRCA